MSHFFKFRGKFYVVEAADWRHSSKLVISEDGEIVYRISFSSGARPDTEVMQEFMADQGHAHHIYRDSYGRKVYITDFESKPDTVPYDISGDYDLPEGARERMTLAHDKIWIPAPPGTEYDEE